MALLLHYTGQDYISIGLLKTELTPGSTSAIVGGCKTGKGFAFTNNNVSDAYTSMTTVYDNQLSISAWIRTNTNSTAEDRLPIFSTSNYIQNQIIFEVYDVNRLRIFVVFNDNTVDVCSSIDNTILPNTWYFVTAQLNKVTRNMQVYINGVLIKSTTYTNKPLQNNNRFFIGRRHDSGKFRGHICNLKVYNHVLSQKEINEDYKSLMLHYKLDKPITTQVFDHSGFNRHIQVIENTTTNSTTEKRVYGGSLNNNGTQGLYGSLNLSELNGINEISVALRFRFISQSGTHGYFSSRTTSDVGISIFKLGGTSREFFIDIAGRKVFTLPYDLVSGSWYDLVAVKSTTDEKLYINGTLINTISNTNSISNMGQLYASISRSIADDKLPLYNAVNGNIQDIRFYAKALTQADVTELYQTRQEIDNLANGYCYELVEGQTSVEMKANGQLYCDEVIENDDGTFSINQNKTIKTKEIKEV